MTRILHTADVHLTPEAPERREALRELLTMAEEDEFDVVTIGGDLFDRPEAVEELRSDLRNDLFADRPFQILLIPGNHDVEAYRGDVFFGDSCTPITQEPFEQWNGPDGDLRITGLPYKERPDDDLLIALQDREQFNGTEVLLLHASLDAPFDDYETGDEETRRYFPVTEELLTELGFDYYLAGHYHSPHRVTFSDGAEFVYPGSPASTRTSETGKRRVGSFEPSDGLDFHTLSTFHYASRTFTVTPGGEDALLQAVSEWAGQHAIDSADASIYVDGYIEIDEEEFYERLTDVAENASITDDTRGVQHLLGHPLYRSFKSELQNTDWNEETMETVDRRTLGVFSELAARGEI